MIFLLKRTELRIGESEVKMSALGQPPHVEEVVHQEFGELPHLGLPLPALFADRLSGLPHGLELHGIGVGPMMKASKSSIRRKWGVGLNAVCVGHLKTHPSSDKNCS